MSVREVKASFPIECVTVYPQSALVTRRARINLKAETSRIIARGLVTLSSDSVRVEVAPEEGLAVIDVSSAVRQLPESADREYGKQKEALDALVRERRTCEAALRNAWQELELHLDRENIESLFANNKYLPVNVESWKEYFSFLKPRLEENRALARKKLFELYSIDLKLKAVSANLARITPEKKEEQDIIITVEAPREAAFSLALACLQESVSWYPVYAVSFEEKSKLVTINLSAIVGQNTGEDWKNVELALSTAIPRFSCSIPVLASRRLREKDAKIELRQRGAVHGAIMAEEAEYSEVEEAEKKESPALPPAGRAAALSKAYVKNKRDHADALMTKGGAKALATETVTAAGQAKTKLAGRDDTLNAIIRRFDQELGAPFDAQKLSYYGGILFGLGKEAWLETPVIEEADESDLPAWCRQGTSPAFSLGGYDYRFTVRGRRDILSQPTPQKVPVMRKELPARLAYVTVPLEKESVYLKAVFANDAANTLPAGPAQVFVEESLQGALEFETLGPNEEGALSLGVEQDVKVLRREQSRRRRRGKEVGDDFTVEIECVNFKKEGVEIYVYDRLPVSRQEKEIIIADFKSSPRAEISERKILCWKLGLAPGEKTKLGFSYSIRHPENYRLVMEQDPHPFQPGKEA